MKELVKLIHIVLKKLNDHNIKINWEKCTFFGESIHNCGFIIGARGIHKDPAEFEAVLNMPPPKNVSELCSFIGMITFHSRFMKNISDILHPLYELLSDSIKFVWSIECKSAFETTKKIFIQDNFLIYFDPQKTVNFSYRC